MPNWVENKVYLQGDKDKINEMLENIKYDDMSIGTVDFNKIIPMPEELVDNGGWSDWRINHWDTKWNACGYDKNADYSDNDYIWFQTAWSAPHPILEKLSKMYPDIKFEHMWADEDFGNNCGRYSYEDGERIEKYIPETRKESLKFAAKVWDYDLDELGYHINADGTDYVNTQYENYELITIFDKPALFTNERLSPKDIPQGLNLYHFRTDDSGQISTIEPIVKCNHGGSVLMSETLDFGEQGFIEFTDETAPNFTGLDISIDDYIN